MMGDLRSVQAGLSSIVFLSEWAPSVLFFFFCVLHIVPDGDLC